MADPVDYYFDDEGFARLLSGTKMKRTITNAQGQKVVIELTRQNPPENKRNKAGEVVRRYNLIETKEAALNKRRVANREKVVLDRDTRIGAYGIPRQIQERFPVNKADAKRYPNELRVGNSRDSIVKAFNTVKAANLNIPMNRENRAVINDIYNEEMKAAILASSAAFRAKRNAFVTRKPRAVVDRTPMQFPEDADW